MEHELMEQPITLVREPAPAVETSLKTCLNCGDALTGPFCRVCGQRDLPPEPDLRELLAEAWDAFVSVDGKVAQTFRLLLTRPGVLTAEYISGKRARFLPPLRLYLLCSVLFFLIQGAASSRPDTPEVAAKKAAAAARAEQFRAQAGNDSVSRARRRVDDTTFARQLDSIRAMPQHTWLWKRFKINGLRVGRDGKNFTTDFKTQIPRTMFIVMPAFALLLALVYRSRRRPYAAHLVVSLHLHAFLFGILALAMIAAWVPWHPAQRAITWPAMAWTFAYFPLALRRVYGGRLGFAIVRGIVLGLTYSIVALLAMSAIALVLVFLY
jgi:hypothetical protein